MNVFNYCVLVNACCSVEMIIKILARINIYGSTMRQLQGFRVDWPNDVGATSTSSFVWRPRIMPDIRTVYKIHTSMENAYMHKTNTFVDENTFLINVVAGYSYYELQNVPFSNCMRQKRTSETHILTASETHILTANEKVKIFSLAFKPHAKW
mgnify:FL=1